MQPGDVVLKFNGKEIGNSGELPALVGGLAPGSEVQIEVWRKGKTQQLRATVEEMKSLAAKDAEPMPGGAATGKLGLALRPLTAEEKGQIEGGRGLFVEQVAEGPAARAGIQPGDVILAANGERVGSVEQLRNQLDRAGKTIAVLVQRGEQTLFVPIRIG
jgi:serine protease Do